MTQDHVWNSILTTFEKTTLSFEQDMAVITIQPDAWLQVSRYLKENQAYQMDYLKYITAVDWRTEIELLVHLFSYRTGYECVVRMVLSHEKPEVMTCSSVWKAANWHEREMYDLFGISFVDHPNLTRLLLPQDWEGHPLRKDYQEATEVYGVSTTRNYLTKLPSIEN